MKDENIRNKKIAKNTLFLYFRMLLIIIVGLYSSRVILNALGVSDYGIYNVVGGIINMLAFLNVGMMGASQRFISYELGKGDENKISSVFATSKTTHLLIALIVLIFAETMGLWFLNTHMNIPEERMFAANWVFQCSVLTFFVSVISVPYNSCIIAHEHMKIYAYVSIFESLARLLVAVSLMLTSSMDKLIYYATLLLLLQISIRIVYTLYCKKHFEECKIYARTDKKLLKEMFSFAGWGMIGNLGFTFKDQGSNIILNLFFGTTVNAARGIAGQVNGIINGFASNFSMAINPQITKLYAAGNIEDSIKLVYTGSRFTFYLLALIEIPFLINCSYVLNLWLGDVPRYTVMFIYFISIGSLLYSLSHAISTAILATGHVKWFQSLLAIILLSELPLSYVILNMGGEPYQAMIPSLVTISMSLVLRIIIVKRYVSLYSLKKYLVGVVARCVIVFALCFAVSLYFKMLLPDTFCGVLGNCIISLVICFTIILFCGITIKERTIVMSKLTNILKKIR